MRGKCYQVLSNQSLNNLKDSWEFYSCPHVPATGLVVLVKPLLCCSLHTGHKHRGVSLAIRCPAIWMVKPNMLYSDCFAALVRHSSLKKPFGSSTTFLNLLNSLSKTLQYITIAGPCALLASWSLFVQLLLLILLETTAPTRRALVLQSTVQLYFLLYFFSFVTFLLL